MASFVSSFPRPGYGEEAVNVSVSVSGLELMELNEREMVLRSEIEQMCRSRKGSLDKGN